MTNFSSTDLLLISLLNLKLSEVKELYSSNDNGIAFVNVTLNRPYHYSCPICGNSNLLSNGYYTKKIKLSQDSLSHVHAHIRVPRLWCRHCNSTFSDRKNMNPPGSSISYKVIQNIMILLQSPDITFTRCAQILKLSPTTVTRIFDKHCHVNRKPLPEVLCIDEVYTKLNDFSENGRISKYSCILYDFYNNQLIDVLPSRMKVHLHRYFQTISLPERLGVKFVVIDMYSTYKDIAKHYFKKAIICVDSFHVIKQLNDSLAKIRIRVMNTYSTSSNEYYLLKKFNFLLHNRTIELENKSKYNKKLNCYLNYSQILELILSIHSDLRQAYNLKELYANFNSTSSLDNASKQIDIIICEFVKADIPEYRPFIDMILHWRKEIINSFSIYKGRRVNNGVAESLNNRISTLLYVTRGIQNHERRRKRIMYAINKTGFLIK